MASTLAGKYESMMPLDMMKPVIDGLKAIVRFVARFKQANVRINVLENVPSELCQYLTAKYMSNVEKGD